MTTTISNATVSESHSPAETQELGKALGKKYPGGRCFYLEGTLGAGKTLFAKGIASAYGIDPYRVVSPTFALVNRYSGEGRTVYHVDLYRIDNERQLLELGLDEIEEEENTILIVEWSEKLGRYRRPDSISVRLENLDDNSRTIHILQSHEESL
jgi:tRNA threonylcarbamoyladenosine biosynthesis protein TsaE